MSPALTAVVRSRISQTGVGDANPQGGSASLLFVQIFPENCMKMNPPMHSVLTFHH